MMALKNRVEKLEDAFGPRRLTPEQLDCLFLYCGAADIPDSSVTERQAVENSAAYRWAQEWLAEREDSSKKRKFDDDAPARFFSSHTEEWWLAALRSAFIRTWERHIPDVSCPLPSITSPGERGTSSSAHMRG